MLHVTSGIVTRLARFHRDFVAPHRGRDAVRWIAGRAGYRARVTCVGLSVKAFFAEGSGPMVLVMVERPQRSEDERP